MNLLLNKIVEYRSMPSYVEERHTLLSTMEQLIEKVKKEDRSMSSLENQNFEQMRKRINEIDLQLAADQVKQTREFKHESYSPAEKEEIRQFVQYVRTGRFEGRDLSSGQSQSVIPKTVEKQIIAKVKELAPLYEKMTHYNVTGNLSIPSYSWDAHTVGWVEDFQAISASGGTFLTVDLEAHALASLALIGNNLINRTDVPVVDIIVEQIATSIANFINDQIINGTTFSGGLPSVTQTVSAESVAGISLDDLITTQMQVPSLFQDEAVWLLNPQSFLAIRRIKDTDGMPLLIGNGNVSQDLGFTLLGKEVLLDENMPTVGANARSIYYGDFRGLVCNQNAPLRTQVLLERYIDINATAVITTMDLDVTLAQPRALATLVHPAV